jgi:hypothetical protein
MRPSRRLARLQLPTTSRLARLREQAATACQQLPAADAKRCIAYVTIETLNTWTEFSRSYFLSCTLRPRRVRGGRVEAKQFTGSTLNDAIGVAMTRHRIHKGVPASGSWPRRDEPTWHDPHVLLTSCADIGCSNLGHIQAALSIPTRAFEDLPVFRNFFGHRNAATATPARNVAAHYSIPGFRHPLDILRSAPSGRPTPLLVDWIDDIRNIVEFLCE